MSNSADRDDVWDVLLEHPSASLLPKARQIIGRELAAIYRPVLTEAPAGRLAELLNMLDEVSVRTGSERSGQP